MAEDFSALAELKAAAPQAAQVREPKIDAQGRSYATGKRKNAVARVWVKPGSGSITVNGRAVEVYFARPVLRMMINQPFQVANRSGQFDVVVTVAGGGLSGQAGAVRHGISRALTFYEPGLRTPLRPAASSPAIPASSNARNTARPKPAAASSSRSADRHLPGSRKGPEVVLRPSRLVSVVPAGWRIDETAHRVDRLADIPHRRKPHAHPAPIVARRYVDRLHRVLDLAAKTAIGDQLAWSIRMVRVLRTAGTTATWPWGRMPVLEKTMTAPAWGRRPRPYCPWAASHHCQASPCNSTDEDRWTNWTQLRVSA